MNSQLRCYSQIDKTETETTHETRYDSTRHYYDGSILITAVDSEQILALYCTVHYVRAQRLRCSIIVSMQAASSSFHFPHHSTSHHVLPWLILGWLVSAMTGRAETGWCMVERVETMAMTMTLILILTLIVGMDGWRNRKKYLQSRSPSIKNVSHPHCCCPSVRCPSMRLYVSVSYVWR